MIRIFHTVVLIAAVLVALYCGAWAALLYWANGGAAPLLLAFGAPLVGCALIAHGVIFIAQTRDAEEQ